MITVFLPEIEAPLKELSMSIHVGWVKKLKLISKEKIMVVMKR